MLPIFSTVKPFFPFNEAKNNKMKNVVWRSFLFKNQKCRFYLNQIIYLTKNFDKRILAINWQPPHRKGPSDVRILP